MIIALEIKKHFFLRDCVAHLLLFFIKLSIKTFKKFYYKYYTYQNKAHGNYKSSLKLQWKLQKFTKTALETTLIQQNFTEKAL